MSTTDKLVKIVDGIPIYVTDSGTFYADVPNEDGGIRLTGKQIKSVEQQLEFATKAQPMLLVSTNIDIGCKVGYVTAHNGRWYNPKGNEVGKTYAVLPYDAETRARFERCHDEYLAIKRSHQQRWRAAIARRHPLNAIEVESYATPGEPPENGDPASMSVQGGA